MRHYAAQIFQNVLLIIMIYFFIKHFLSKKFEKLSSKWWKIEKKSVFRKIYFIYGPLHLFYLLFWKSSSRSSINRCEMEVMVIFQ